MRQSTALKYIARFEYGDALAREVRTDGDVPVFGSNGIAGSHIQSNTLAPAIIVGRKGSYGKVAWTDVPGFCIDTAFYLDRRHTQANIRWLFWTLQTLGLDENSEDTGVPGLSREKAHQEKLWIPTQAEQERIANFLDAQTGRIDALIAEKEQLCERLIELTIADLGHICFGGLSTENMMKTGNTWIPQLPKSWKLVRLKHLVSGIEQGWSPECEARLAESGEWGVLKAGAANAGAYRELEHKALPSHLEPIPELEVKSGDVLVTRASGSIGFVGSFAYVYLTRPQLMLSDKNFRLLFPKIPLLHPELLAWMCNTYCVRQQILQYVSGADGLAKNIGSGSLKELWLALPPMTEQKVLLEIIRCKREASQLLQSHVAEHIDRLREYRSSLISAAVTGQLDIAAFENSMLAAA